MQIWRAKFETVSLVAVVPKIRFVPLEKKYPSTHAHSSEYVRSLPTFQCFTLLLISPFMLNENIQ